MSALPKQKMTVEEFLAWADGRDGRWELADGLPVAMSPERVVHVEVKFAAAKAFEAAITKGRLPCRMLLDGVAVRVDSRTTFQPDMLIYCGDRLPRDAMEAVNPVVVLEVLSPSTRAVDLGLKVRRYFEVPSIHHYLILDPDDRSVIHHARGERDTLLTRIVSEGPLDFTPPGFSIEVASLFPAP